MDCIESKYFKGKGGYARKFIPETKKVIQHHRYIYEQHYGPIPKGFVVRHKCDNPACINIEHLELGTHQDNMKDRNIRNRTCKGINHPKSKLTNQQVKEIRNSNLTEKKLGELYSVSSSLIGKIKRRKTWKHI